METRDGSHTDAEGAFGASSQSSGLDDWIVDSGASSIMTWSRELLVEYKEFNKPQKVCLGDGSAVKAFGSGNIQFRMIFEGNKFKKVTMYNNMYVQLIFSKSGSYQGKHRGIWRYQMLDL